MIYTVGEVRVGLTQPEVIQASLLTALEPAITSIRLYSF